MSFLIETNSVGQSTLAEQVVDQGEDARLPDRIVCPMCGGLFFCEGVGECAYCFLGYIECGKGEDSHEETETQAE